jgi:hypothetical protein
MPRVLLIRPNDFIADQLTSLLRALDIEATRFSSVPALEAADWAGVVGAVVSTAVTSSMPLSVPQAVNLARRRARVPLVMTTMLENERTALELVQRELTELPQLVLFGVQPATRTHPALGTPDGVLVLRKREIEQRAELTVELLGRHLGLREST